LAANQDAGTENGGPNRGGGADVDGKVRHNPRGQPTGLSRRSTGPSGVKKELGRKNTHGTKGGRHFTREP